MKKKNIAMLMAMTMITSGVTGSMEAVYASDEVQIQSEDAFESESGDVTEESTDVTGDTEDSFTENSAKKIRMQRKNSQICSLMGQKMLPRIVRKWLKAEVQMLEMPFIDCMQMELWLSTVQEHL